MSGFIHDPKDKHFIVGVKQPENILISEAGIRIFDFYFLKNHTDYQNS